MEDRELTQVFLAEAPSGVERGLLERWLRDEHGTSAELVIIPRPEAMLTEESAPFVRRLAAGDDPLLTPLRVVWLPKERDGERTARIRDLVLGDPRNPNPLRQKLLARTATDRIQVIEAEPARSSEMRERFRESAGEPDAPLAFESFVARQAALALERAEYRAHGARYKVPKFVREEILSSARFRDGVERLTHELGRDSDEVLAEATECLDEMATGYSQFNLDLMVKLGRAMVRPGYGGEIDYDPEQVERVRTELQRHPAIILPSHKSNLDALVTPIAMFDNGLPRTHTFAGINMDLWPLGPIMRRSGRIFIRRSIRDQPVYRWVLREYIGYVVEKRFSLEWYIEGGRSRTGKLLPPKMGLLRYVVDAYAEGRTDDVALIPVSIVYDELHEVSEYAAEARGAKKQAESLRWFVRFYRGQKGDFGKVYVRFGEPLSLRSAVEASATESDADDDDHSLTLQKIAFEVSTRINAVTPITASALVCLVLLATRGRALTATEIRFAMDGVLQQAQLRRLPLADSARRIDQMDDLQVALASMATNRTIDAYAAGGRTVYSVAPGQQHAAAFYRNTIIHFLVGGSIAELALLHAAQRDSDQLDAFWTEAFRLRDLLKFDFFFEQREAFRTSLATELTERLPGWEDRLVTGADATQLLDELQPLQAFAALRPFIEAYAIVARALLAEDTTTPVDEKPFLRSALALGERLLRQQRIKSPEAISKQLLAVGWQLADHERLTTPGDDLAARRQRFADELKDVLRRVDVTELRTYESLGRSITSVDL